MAELALKWPEAREAGTDRQVLDIALQMEGIVTRSLSLARSLAMSLGCTLTAAFTEDQRLSLTLSGPVNAHPPASSLPATAEQNRFPNPEFTRS